MVPFYHQLGLPISLKEMSMGLTEAGYQEVAERACIEGETIHYIKQKITPGIVETAMQDLGKYIAAK